MHKGLGFVGVHVLLVLDSLEELLFDEKIDALFDEGYLRSEAVLHLGNDV